MESGAWSLVELIVNFSSVFSAPSFNDFTALVRGWVLCQRNIRQPNENQGSAKIAALSNAAWQELVSAAA